MGKVICKESFIEAASHKFNGKFDYQDFTYINAKTRGTIRCPEHGAFTQSPDKHLNSKYGCKHCAEKYKNKKGKPSTKPRVTLEQYTDRVFQKFGGRFRLDTSQWLGLTEGVVKLFCDKHGESEYNPRSILISAEGCKFCGDERRSASKTKTYDHFVEDATNLFHGKYQYPATNRQTYTNRKSVVEIICSSHGTFRKSAQKHLSGQGCFECRVQELVENGKLAGSYGESYFKSFPELAKVEGTLYYLRVGRRYKIGVTTNLPSRLKSIRSQSKQEVVILDSFVGTLERVFLFEQRILQKYKEHRISRYWSTELFDIDVLNSSLQGEVSDV